MGQARLIINLTKQEYLDPRDFGEGYKSMEFGLGGGGTLTALAILLTDESGMGGGDFNIENDDVIGRWCGDEIVIIGDYSTTKYIKQVKDTYEYAYKNFENISLLVREEMTKDEDLNDALE